MPDVPPRRRARPSVRTAVVWDVLRSHLGGPDADHALDVLDAGGGTGGFAVPLAELGHRVVVVDPSPDALAALERRTAEAGVTGRVEARQGDVATLSELVPAGSVDVVLCHGVLEHVDDPAAALAAIVRCLRPDGVLSVLAANRHAAVLARAVAGHLAEARHAFVDPDGRWGEGDPVSRRFSENSLLALLTDAGLRVQAVHGARIFTDLVPGSVVDLEPGSVDTLLDLEADAAEDPVLRAVAAHLHVLATLGQLGGG